MKRPTWSTGKELVTSFQYKTGVSGDKMAILASVWHKELGHLSAHWEMEGVKKGILYIKPRSSSAAQELQLRASGIIRGLNKYFEKDWIKGIKISSR